MCHYLAAVLRIRIRNRIRSHRIHVFLGVLDLDPDSLVTGVDHDFALVPDQDPTSIMEK